MRILDGECDRIRDERHALLKRLREHQQEYEAQLLALEEKKDRAAKKRGDPEADKRIRKLEGRARA